MIRVAAALCVGILLLLVLLDRGIGIDGARPALAHVLQALEEAPIMHKTLRTRYDGPSMHLTEDWYDFKSRTVVCKYSTDGQCTKIASLNYDTKEDMAYDPRIGTVTVDYYIDVSSDAYPASAAGVVADYLKNYKFWGAETVREKSRYEGREVDVYHLRIEPTERREEQYAALIVDPRTDLPLAISREIQTSEGVVKFSQGILFDFPATGPKDIYDLGVPRTAPVVVDAASKERKEKWTVLGERIPQLKERFERSVDRVYRLDEGQVLALISPASIAPRLEWEQAENERGRLVEEQVEARLARSGARSASSQRAEKGRNAPGPGQTPPGFQCFLWDNGIDLEKSRPAFRGSATIQQAFERIVGLSIFEYEILQDPTEVDMPGDWVVRKGSSKQERVLALEKIVQQHTAGRLRFEPRQVQREVIVARGTFHFRPLAGTYNNSWIHVYADQLDPDTRGGGGSGSLAEFIRQFGEVNLDQQVVDETQGDHEIAVNFGWHMSGYVHRIADEKERSLKLRLVLDNVSRQTGLTFSVERRIVTVWQVKKTD